MYKQHLRDTEVTQSSLTREKKEKKKKKEKTETRKKNILASNFI